MDGDRFRVLLVEDSRADADLIREMLSSASGACFELTWVERLARGVELLCAGRVGGAEGPELPELPFDVVLLDFNLPDSAGIATFEAAHRAAPEVPILILTNLRDEEVALAAVREGAQDYLIKREVEGRSLIRAIRYAIERTRADRELRESKERFALVAQGANDGLWDWDLTAGTVYYSPRWKVLLGLDREEVGEDPAEWLDRVHPDDAPDLRAALETHLQGASGHFEHEHRIRRGDGSYLWVASRGLAVRHGDRPPHRMAGSIIDISARKQAEAQLVHDAFHDALTRLPNRALFLDRLGVAMVSVQRAGESHFAVLFLDLDRFKNLNDSLGHAMGDLLLREMAGRLTAGLRPGDTVARLGGDEFALLLGDVGTVAAAAQVARRVQSLVSERFVLEGHEVFTTASMGIALSATGYQRPADMLRDADIAMYRAKAAGKARYEVFDRDMHRSAVALLELETDLRRALEEEQFVMHYQPIVALESGAVVGFEALVRWRHPRRGLVPPASFIAVAEETGLIVPLGWWVLAEACVQIADWNARFASEAPRSVSCNVSGKLIAQPDVVDRVVAILESSALDPSLLRLEITENVVIDHGPAVLDHLSELRALGVQLHIDDFGTGYSSLSYLQRFRYDTLKIDRSFVSALGRRGEEGGQIVQTIVALGNQLQMNVIAEGVETEDQARWLRRLHCPQGQGYWFARPLDPPRIEALLERRKLGIERGGRGRSPA